MEGNFQWADGGTENPATTGWLGGPPDNAAGNEDCGQIWKSSGEKLYLNDFPCSAGRYYICEIDI